MAQENIVNTFEKGLITDVHPQYQPKGSYRECKNMRLINNGGNNYTLQDDEGMTVVVTIPFPSDDFTIAGTDRWEIIGWEAYEDLDDNSDSLKVVVLLNGISDNDGNDWGSVGVFSINTETGSSAFQHYYSHQDMSFDEVYTVTAPQIKIIYETEDIIRIYWTDGQDQPKVLNLALYNEVASGSLVNGNKYMVVGGHVLYSAIVYGEMVVGSFGSVFTANATNTYTAYGSAKVIDYIPLEVLDWSVDRTLPKIQNLSAITAAGNIRCGVYSLVVRCRYGNEYVGPWTPAHSFQHVYQESINVNPVPGDYIQGDDVSVYTDKTLQWDVTIYDDWYDILEVAIVRGTGYITDLGGVWDSAELIYSGTFTAGTPQTIQYDGSQLEGTFTSIQLAAIYEVFNTVGTITSIKNILFAGDVDYADSLPDVWDSYNSNLSLTEVTYELPGDNRDYVTSPPITGHLKLAANISAGITLVVGQHYQVDAVTATYNGVSYQVNSIFKTIHNITTHTGNTISPVDVTIHHVAGVETTLDATKYYLVIGNTITVSTDTFPVGTIIYNESGTYTGSGTAHEVIFDVVTLDDDLGDMRGMVTGANKKGYMRNETYHFGLLPYDTKGNPLPVRYIAEHNFSDINSQPIHNEGFTAAYTMNNSLNALGLKIGNDYYAKSLGTEFIIPSEWLDPNEQGAGSAQASDSLISGFSIVRAKSDENIVAKGILFNVVYDSGNSVYKPLAHIRETYDSYTTTGDYPYYVLYAPDLLMDTSIDLTSGEYEIVVEECINVNSTVGVSDPQGILEISGGTANEAYYVKYVTAVALPATISIGDSHPIENIVRVTQGDTNGGSGIAIDPTDDTVLFENITKTATGAPWAAAGQDGIGGTAHVIKISEGGALDPHTTTADTRKLLVSIRRKGGEGYPSKENLEWKPTGHYQPITQTWLDDTYGIISGLEIYGGDTYIGWFDYGRVVMDEDTTTQDEYALGLIFPTESRMNLWMRRGRHFAKDGFKLSGTGNENGISEISPENLIVDRQHMIRDYVNSYPSFIKDDNTLTKGRRYVHYSNTKSSGEDLDSWRKFLVGNKTELDTRGGKLYALVAKTNYLFAFQTNMITYLPVQEKIAITEAFEQAFTIGTGGVLERIDIIDSFLGCEDKESIIEVPDGIIYFNRSNQAIVYLKMGSKGIEISSVKQIKQIIDNELFKGELSRSTSEREIDNVVAGYDKRNKEVLMTLRTANTTLFTIGMADDLKMFTAKYDFTPARYLSYRNMLLSFPDIRGYSAIANSTAYVVGDIVIEERSTNGLEWYICIVDLPDSGSPATVPSSNPTNWTKVYSEGEICAHNWDKTKPAFYYGVPYDSEVTIVVNQNNNMQKMFDSFIINGEVHNGVSTPANAVTDGTGMCSTIETETSYQSRSETPQDIKWRNNNFIGTFQTDNTDTVSKRLRDKYLKVTLKKQNWVTDAATSSGVLRKIVSLISKIRNSF